MPKYFTKIELPLKNNIVMSPAINRYHIISDNIEGLINTYNFKPHPKPYGSRLVTKEDNISDPLSTMDFFNTELYKNQIRNNYPNITEKRIGEILSGYENNLKNVTVYTNPYLNSGGSYSHRAKKNADGSVSLVDGVVLIGVPDANDGIFKIGDWYITRENMPSTYDSRVAKWRGPVAFHEYVHATTGAGRFAPKEIMESNIDFTPDMSTSVVGKEQMTPAYYEYLSHPDEGRARFLSLLKELGDSYIGPNGNLNQVSDNTLNRILDGMKKHSGQYRNNINIRNILDWYSNDKIIKTLRKVMGFAAPVAVGAALQNNDKK